MRQLEGLWWGVGIGGVLATDASAGHLIRAGLEGWCNIARRADRPCVLDTDPEGVDGLYSYDTNWLYLGRWNDETREAFLIT